MEEKAKAREGGRKWNTSKEDILAAGMTIQGVAATEKSVCCSGALKRSWRGRL